MFSTWQNINLDSADKAQNWDMVMFLVTTLEMIFTGIKKTNNFHISPQNLLFCISNVAQYILHL